MGSPDVSPANAVATPFDCAGETSGRRSRTRKEIGDGLLWLLRNTDDFPAHASTSGRFHCGKSSLPPCEGGLAVEMGSPDVSPANAVATPFDCAGETSGRRSRTRKGISDGLLWLLRNTDDFPAHTSTSGYPTAENHRCHPARVDSPLKWVARMFLPQMPLPHRSTVPGKRPGGEAARGKK